MRTSWIINNKRNRIGIQTKLNWGINETHNIRGAEQEFSEKRAGAEAEDSDRELEACFSSFVSSTNEIVGGIIVINSYVFSLLNEINKCESFPTPEMTEFHITFWPTNIPIICVVSSGFCALFVGDG